MSLSLSAAGIDEHRSKMLIDLAEKALTDSSRLISALGETEIKFSLDSLSRLLKDDLINQFDQNETEMVAVCQRLDCTRPGQIIFMLPEPSALLLVKKLLNERNLLKEMTEIEGESLTEVGNIIINNCLRNFVKIFHESISGLIPTLIRGHYAQLVDVMTADSNEKEKDIFLVKVDVAIGGFNLNGYILWLGHLCQANTGIALNANGSCGEVNQ